MTPHLECGRLYARPGRAKALAELLVCTFQDLLVAFSAAVGLVEVCCNYV